MTQNTSHAVMSQRAEPHDSLDYFPTPPWATRALCKYIIDIRGCNVWEPACGGGHMAEPLCEYARSVRATDVHDYGYGGVRDFLFPRSDHDLLAPVDWIITNPPFRLAEQFVLRGLEIAGRGVAMLVRTVFLESTGRYHNLFVPRPPAIIAQFAERVAMVKGRLDPVASSATSYCWLVWDQRTSAEPIFRWIPPCRAKLERVTDWPKVVSMGKI
jgi:hypothetical protein